MITKPIPMACLVAAILATGLTAWAQGAESLPKRPKAQPVEIIHAWSGKLADEALRKHEPAAECVLDQETWTRLWKAWRGQEAVPAEDFQRQMVLVFTASGPNHVGCTPTLDGRGNLQAQAQSTLIGGPGFGYLMQCLSRHGVKTVNGKP